MILVTGATGQLGRLVINALLTKIEPNQIIAAVRNPEKASDIAEKGVQVRHIDYNQPSTLLSAFEGVEKLLLISSSEIGHRINQHKHVIDAAKANNVSLIAYTSILNANNSPLLLAQEHAATETLLKKSGMPHVILRNGWYSENYTMSIMAAIEHNTVFGCAGNGKLSTAARVDYAEAAAIVLMDDNQAGKIYELAGDNAFTLTEYAAAISAASNTDTIYNNLSEPEYTHLLVGAGLAKEFAALLADTEAKVTLGALYSDSKDLSTLIGHPTTSISMSIKQALS